MRESENPPVFAVIRQSYSYDKLLLPGGILPSFTLIDEDRSIRQFDMYIKVLENFGLNTINQRIFVRGEEELAYEQTLFQTYWNEKEEPWIRFAEAVRILEEQEEHEMLQFVKHSFGVANHDKFSTAKSRWAPSTIQT